MSNNNTNQNHKQFTIDFQQNFQHNLQQFIIQFSQINQNDKYSIDVDYCDSDDKMHKLFKGTFQFIFNRNSNLIKLVFWKCTFSVSSLKLFSQQDLSKLQVILIFNSKLNDECVEFLSKCNIPQLKQLAFQNCEITDVEVSHICNGKWYKLKQLMLGMIFKNLGKNNITSAGFRQIATSHLKNLQLIGLEENNLHGHIENIGELFNYPQMKILILADCGIGEDILQKLDKSKQPLLEKLIIYDCPCSGKQLFSLQRNLGWENLKSLCIGSETVNKQQVYFGLKNICEYKLPYLKQLAIGDFFVSKKCAKFFIKSQWNHLTLLALQNESVKIINKCSWKSLKDASFNKNKIADNGINYLGHSIWPEFEKTQLNHTLITRFGIMNLLKSSVINVCLNKNEEQQAPKILKQIMELTFE